MTWKVFREEDVLTAARSRVREIIDLHDSVVVSFSGGKDSLVVLHLVREAFDALGLGKVNAIFYDEELIPNNVIEFVDGYRRQPWLDLKWLAVPLESHKFILGKTMSYVQWDPNRPHVRSIPEWAITNPTGYEGALDQYKLNHLIGSMYPGKVAILTGLRAQESFRRLKMFLNRPHKTHISRGPENDHKIAMGTPIYDWTQMDVFKYLYENEIAYCVSYDNQLLAGASLRVSTPLHAESAKRFDKLRSVDPDFYQRVVDVFPEMFVQERYFAQMDRDSLIKQYGSDYTGCRAYIEDKIDDPREKALALKRLNAITNARDSSRYPAIDVLKYLIAGGFKRHMLPKKRRPNAGTS